MREALVEAEKAHQAGEVPVAVVVDKEGKIIGRGHNLVVAGHDPSGHAGKSLLLKTLLRIF